MNIRTKLILMLALPLLALAVVGAVGFRSQSAVANTATESQEDDAVVQSFNRAIKAIGAERLAIAQDISNRAELRFESDQSLLDIIRVANDANQLTAVEDVIDDVTSNLNAGRLSRVFAVTIDEFNEANDTLRTARDGFEVAYPNQQSFAEAASINLAVDIAERQDAVWLEYIAVEDIPTELADQLRVEATATDVLRREIVDLAPENHTASLNATLAGDADVTIRQTAQLAIDRIADARPTLDSATVLDAVADSHEDWYGHAVALQADVEANLDDVAATAVSRQNLFALLGTLGLLVIFGLVYVVYHSVVTPLNKLLSGAEAVASDHLPTAVDELRTMGSDDSSVRLEPLPRENDDELGALVDAFNDVQLTAFDLAVEQARSRRNIAEMFVNLGRRNQKLLQRMLDVISTLENDEQNAGKLEKLFELDHMTTRMRRNAESLLVVAGTTSPRQWSKPVPAADVVRSALAEVQDYHRIDVLGLAEAPMAGNAVADVTHMLAELLENSLQFSEPESRVSISSRWTDGNYRIVITDQGFGMTPVEMDENNALIANPPPPDQAPTRFLGLFVVGHLAKRHGIGVSLSDATIGGTDARITIPASMMTESSPAEQGLLSGDLPTRDADDEGLESDTHLDLDAELAKLTAETEELREAELAAEASLDTDVFAATDADDEAPAVAPASDTEQPVEGQVEVFTGESNEPRVGNDTTTFTGMTSDAPAQPQTDAFANATAAAPAPPAATPAPSEATTFASAATAAPARGETNIDFGQAPELPKLEKLPPRPPSSLGDLPIRNSAPVAVAPVAEAPAPVAAPAPAAPAPAAPAPAPAANELTATGLPQRTPRATLQNIDGIAPAPAAPAQPAPAAPAAPAEAQDVTSAAANVGSMFSAFQAGVQRGEQKTN